MFGYIRTDTPELKIREFALYRSVYCTLCRTLGRRYGLPARLLLSYDGAFLAMFAVSLSKTAYETTSYRCPFNVFKRCRRCISDSLPFENAADLCVILAYYKLVDDLADEGFFARAAGLLLRPFLSRYHRRAAQRLPQAERLAREYSLCQAALEQGGPCGTDRACEPTAVFLRGIFDEFCGGRDEPAISDIGYYLGRWVYLADAADDLEKDSRSGAFNPYRGGDGYEAALKRAHGDLNSAAYMMDRSLERLPRGEFTPVIDNVLSGGCAACADRVCRVKKDGKGKK